MHLSDIISTASRQADGTLPDWMIGCFKRRSITFANGLSDLTTDVFWLQSRNITIDLRLPTETERVPSKSIAEYTPGELRQLANYEGWCAQSHWQEQLLSWSGGTGFQTHNRWPEPAILRRVGDCMIEHSPTGTYVEDWRLRSQSPGPLVGLRLLDETDLSNGEVRHRDGALIINGDYAGLVLGRSQPLLVDPGSQLRDYVSAHLDNQHALDRAFNVETSVARGNLIDGYRVAHSTQRGREGETLISLEGFEWSAEENCLTQIADEYGIAKQRRFTIDTLEPCFNFSPETGFSQAAKQWFDDEQETLGRYLGGTPT